MKVVKERLAKVISELSEKKFTVEELKNNEFFTLGINSLTFIKIVVAIEEEFDITFDDDELNYEMFGEFEVLCATIEEKINLDLMK